MMLNITLYRELLSCLYTQIPDENVMGLYEEFNIVLNRILYLE